jgi:hypothetical protein
MTFIEALLSLPEYCQPQLVDQQVAATLAASPAGFARRQGVRWCLSDRGRRFVLQFKPAPPGSVTHVVVRLVMENGVPVFDLRCDSGRVLRVNKSGLQRSLLRLQTANPGVKFVFDYRRSGDAS